MKRIQPTRKAPFALMGAGLLAMTLAGSAGAAEPLQGHIALRPLTPTEVAQYKLTGVQGASGLNTIGVGQPAYLEALVNKLIPAGEITKVTWSLTSSPAGSSAALAESPLGQDVPTYKMAERLVAQVAGRTLLRPDVVGQYTVSLAIETANNGSTNLTETITAGTYMGENTCALCHSGGQIADNVVDHWSKTGHATFFTKAIDGLENPAYASYCISCHTVGYDANTNAVNGGFDDIAKEVGWTFPKALTNGNWAAMPAKLQNVANIQCENCHGPGSQHAFSLGDPSKISKTLAAGDCGQCHQAAPHHVKNDEWNNSKHAIAVDESGPGREGCVGCHTGNGFVGRMSTPPSTNTAYEAITCAACHDPHDATNPHQLRSAGPVKLMNGYTITSDMAGKGILCMECHKARVNGPVYAETTAGNNRFGPHHGPQSDMLMGTNGYTYGQNIPSSAHKDVVGDSCVTCHMQEVGETAPGHGFAGGHTFNMTAEASGTNGPVHMTEACKQCHGEIENFDFARQDYDGDGVVDGVQTEVRHLLDKLGSMLPPVGPKTSIAIDSKWTRQQLKAGFNYLMVQEDRSMGIHNLAYTVGLLKASIADLSGDANNDKLPDAWQIQYFGSVNAANARPDATPAGDGIPNWLKYSLGLDPTVPGTVMPNGVVWANGKGLVNPPIDPGATNSLAIYTAAEVVFNTEAGKSYQIQAASADNMTWQNVGGPVTGTGSPVSFVTPTRTGVKQFFRVNHD